MSTYIIKSGDTASKIASQYGTTVAELQKANPQYSQFTSNPNYIQAGWSLNLPTTQTQGSQPLSALIGSNIPISSANLGAKTTQTINTNGAPPISTNVSDVSAKNAATLAQLEAIKQQALKIQEQIPTATGYSNPTPPKTTTTDTGSKGVLQTILDKIAGRETAVAAQPTETETLNTTLAQYGITPENWKANQNEINGLQGQLQNYNQQIVDLQSQERDALNVSEDKQMPMGLITGEQASIERRYNAKIATVSAQATLVNQQIAIKTNQMPNAVEMTKMFVDAATYDAKQKVEDMDWALTTYKDVYDILSKQEQQDWDNQFNLLKENLATQKDDLTNMNNMMLKCPSCNINPISDTYTEAVAKFNAGYKETTPTPSSYNEWTLAGGEAGTGMTYAQFLSKTSTTTSGGVVAPDATKYDRNSSNLFWLTAPGSPGNRTSSAYEKEAILAFAYASSGKQMSWNEAKQLYAAYIPNILDSEDTKVNKILGLESAIDQVIGTATGPSATQGQIAKQKITFLKEELGIKPKINQSSTYIVPEGTDGTTYGFPGYVSDGTQWVKK